MCGNNNNNNNNRSGDEPQQMFVCSKIQKQDKVNGQAEG